MEKKKGWIFPLVSGLLVGILIASIFFVSPNQVTNNITSSTTAANTAAEKTYVPPGQLDEYYIFASGGHSGNLYVYGVPSMRRIRTIPVFTPESATGYGFDKDSKEMLGGYTWGDLHHPAISETDGEYDGKWLFANDNANNRAAVIDLKTFQTKDILGPIPNIMGPHCAAFVTPNTEYFFMPSRFAAPVDGQYADVKEFKEKYKGVLAAISFDEKTEKLSTAWEVMLPPWSYDISDAGKKSSDGWAVLSTYNTEEAYTTIEVGASQNDRDYIVVLNWRGIEKEVANGNFEEIGGAKVFDPVKNPGYVFLVPVSKSPHGVDVTPDGKYYVGSGKLAPTVTVYSFEKTFEAIKNKKFTGEVRGLPVIDYDTVKEAEVEVGLGPLHTQFGADGVALTTLFLDSAIAKWKIGEWKVTDKVQVQYAPGHSVAAEGDTVSPDGNYIVALNKIAKDSYLSVGPSHPESMQLIDLRGEKMEVLYSAPVDPEPHYAQMIKADKIKTIEVFEKDVNRPNSVWKKEDARIERNGDEVHVYGYAVRSRFVFNGKSETEPDVIRVKQGDKVTVHVTNIDLDEDITHGFGIPLYNLNMEIQPGETKTMEFVADRSGVFPYYCTNFCSALHQEMQGFLLVEPK
ncbi:Sec-dependent nitrous-oxide reductase [Microaerobacter geothermalis]|uniref:Sec-dependent nitrous-oxide reductase n=1 Tax=Microaerobacter geothermalis TaxID=674972 RepID=UPI001F2FF184|nr:Sec-dependent nitrous-oxide reductase [Microaerobacter geothermalis]MCF6092451.1 Sec-dependent nitrous-oxide reductase [Microaerobacter geothermalis]